jgi:hypothetical protein
VQTIPVQTIPPAPSEAPAATPPVAGDAPKFKLRPKEPGSAGAPPTIPATPPAVPAPVLFAPDPAVPVKAPPPFPVVAEARPRGTISPIPHIRAAVEVPPAEEPVEAAPPPKVGGRKTVVVAIVACAVLGGGAFAYWKIFHSASPVAPIVQQKKATPSVPATPAPAPPPSVPSAPTTPPTDVVSALAHAPANAINKAQDVIAARRASEQNRVDAIAAGEEPAIRPTPPANQAATPSNTTAVRALAPGLSATIEIEGSPEGSPAFRSFVANAKISGVVAGAAPKMFINGRLVRIGETIDPALGVVFERIDAEKRQVIFRDKAGATAARRF